VSVLSAEKLHNTYDTCESPVEMYLMQDSTNSFIRDGMWDLVEEANQWQYATHPPLTNDMLLQQTFTYNVGWDENLYQEEEGETHWEELNMDAKQRSSSAHQQAPAVDEEERDTDSDSYN
jgi:hypothetical protein